MIGAGVEVDRYLVEAEVGAGGTATVWRVRHRMLGSHHAMKVLNVGSAAHVQRLLQEGRIQSQLDHPNLVPVSDVVAVRGGVALVMPYVAGPTLAEWLRFQRPTLEEALALMRGVLDGLEYAHDHGVIHRDLKPANILLAPIQSGFLPRITDFGLARGPVGEDDAAVTRSGVGMGTITYMAPEQARSARDVDARADLYSLGCVLYELLTGRRAFPDQDVVAATTAAARGDFVPVRTLAPDVPPAIAELVTACLSPDPAGRPASCAAIREALFGPSPPAPARRDDAQVPSRAIAALATVTLPPSVPLAPASRWPRVLAVLALSAVVAVAGWPLLTARLPVAYPFTTGGALRFDGTSGFVEVPASPSLDLVDAITIEVWLRAEGWFRGDMIPVLDRVWRLDVNRYLLTLTAGKGGGTATVYPLSLDEWTHVALTYDVGERVIRWFVDGLPVGGDSYTEPLWVGGPGTDAAPLVLGGGPTGFFEYAQGYLDDVRIWSRVHSPDEVRRVALGEDVDPTGLVGWWTFDEQDGDRALDRSGLGNHGALVGGVTRVPASELPDGWR